VNANPKQLATTVLALLIAGMPLRGDEKSPGRPAEKSPYHNELARLVGSWDATVTFRFGAKDNQGQASCEARWILDEHCVQQEYKSTFMGKPLTILQLITFDAGKKKLEEIHMTNLDGGALFNEGDSVAGGKEWKLAGPYVDPATRKPTQLRTVYTFGDADHFTLDWFVRGADGKETRAVHIEHVRRK
jgi:hypothetical protein